MNNYLFITDPGHGWLAVPISDLKKLGIENKITAFSYRKGETAFLEEDVDAGTFLKAAQAAGMQYTIKEKYEENTSIRSYLSYYI